MLHKGNEQNGLVSPYLFLANAAKMDPHSKIQTMPTAIIIYRKMSNLFG